MCVHVCIPYTCMGVYCVCMYIYMSRYVCSSFLRFFFFVYKQYVYEHVYVCVCVFPLLPSQAGHDSWPTAAEQPSQDLFLTLLACLLQPGQKELHAGVRMRPLLTPLHSPLPLYSSDPVDSGSDLSSKSLKIRILRSN